MSEIELTGLTKRYKDVTAVDNLCLSIEKGELYSLLGVNGAGKTTTIKMLSCLVKPDDGDALLSGYSIKNQADLIKRIIAISPQETAVAPNLSVLENLLLMCGVHGMSKSQSSDRASEISQRLGLCDVLCKRAKALSGGWQRRLSIAMALISKPQILFLDEPTLGLDVIARSELWDTIKELKGSTTIILTTHYMEEAEALSDRIGIMKNGRLLISDSAENIKEITAQSSFEQAFIKIVRG